MSNNQGKLSDDDVKAHISKLQEALNKSEECKTRYGLAGRVAERLALEAAETTIPFVKYIAEGVEIAEDVYQLIKLEKEVVALKDIIKTLESEPRTPNNKQGIASAKALLAHAEYCLLNNITKTILAVLKDAVDWAKWGLIGTFVAGIAAVVGFVIHKSRN